MAPGWQVVLVAPEIAANTGNVIRLCANVGARLHLVEPLGFALDDEASFALRGGAPLPPNPIPPEYNRQSRLTTEVKAGHNEYNFDVPDPAT